MQIAMAGREGPRHHLRKGDARNTSKMDLDDWSGARIWREVDLRRRSPQVPHRQPRESSDRRGGPRVPRQPSAALSDRQIRDLFGAAMVERRGGTVDDWVRVFKRKRDEIVKARCGT